MTVRKVTFQQVLDSGSQFLATHQGRIVALRHSLTSAPTLVPCRELSPLVPTSLLTVAAEWLGSTWQVPPRVHRAGVTDQAEK